MIHRILCFPLGLLLFACGGQKGPQADCLNCEPVVDLDTAIEAHVFAGRDECEPGGRGLPDCGDEPFEARVLCEGMACDVLVYRDFPLLMDEPTLESDWFSSDTGALVEILPAGAGDLRVEITVRRLEDGAERTFDLGAFEVAPPDELVLSCERDCQVGSTGSVDLLVHAERGGRRVLFDPDALDVTGADSVFVSELGHQARLSLRFETPGEHLVRVEHRAGVVVEQTLTID